MANNSENNIILVSTKSIAIFIAKLLAKTFVYIDLSEDFPQKLKNSQRTSDM